MSEALSKANCSYPTIIKSPMDLSTVAAKLENGIYRSRSDFVSDIRLIIANCTLYNASGSDIYNAARRFEAAFDNCEYISVTLA